MICSANCVEERKFMQQRQAYLACQSQIKRIILDTPPPRKPKEQLQLKMC